jgi:hypothetical protein
LLKSQWPRLLVRLIVFAILLHVSGWTAVNPLTWSLLALPVAQTLVTMLTLKRFTATRRPGSGSWSSSLQRGYQGLFIFLLLSALMHTLSYLHTSSGGFWSLVGLGVSALSSDHAAEIAIDHDTPTQYHITLRGSFELVWEPRDNFEKWMLILFLRRLQHVGETRPFLRHHHLEKAFEVDSPTISHWTREVEAHSWHILSDRYRHQIHSLLPDASLSRAILKTWVPAFAHVPSPKGWGGPARG